MSPQRRNWMVGGTLVGLLLLAGSYMLLISPNLERISQAEAEIDRTEQVNVRHQKDLADLKVQFENIESLRQELSRTEYRVPVSPRLNRFEVEVDRIAKRNGTRLDEIVFAPPFELKPPKNSEVKTPNVAFMETQIKLSGKRPDLLMALWDLQRQPRVFAVHRVTWQVSDESLKVFGAILVAKTPATGKPQTAVDDFSVPTFSAEEQEAMLAQANADLLVAAEIVNAAMVPASAEDQRPLALRINEAWRQIAALDTPIIPSTYKTDSGTRFRLHLMDPLTGQRVLAWDSGVRGKVAWETKGTAPESGSTSGGSDTTQLAGEGGEATDEDVDADESAAN